MTKDIFSDYDSAVDFLFNSRPHGTIKLGLERIKKLLSFLDNPQQTFQSIQTAGTNGKGSVTRTLSTLMNTAGFKTGANYSPHLTRFNERITIDNKEISNNEVVRAVNRIHPAVTKMDNISEEMRPSFFECVTALAFQFFKSKKVDTAAVEVGLGGRLDATTALSPIITVITSIGLDHTKTLGDTIEKIAYEKAGIIKPGTPIISGVQQKEACAVIEAIAKEKEAPFYQLGSDFNYTATGFKPGQNTMDFFDQRNNAVLKDVTVSLNGEHQLANTATALMAYQLFCEITSNPFDEGVIRQALSTVFWPGRFEIISHRDPQLHRPLIVVDGAHNQQGISALVRNWRHYFKTSRPVLLTAMLSGKEYEKMVKELSSISGDVIVTEPKSPRKTDTQLILNAYKKYKNDEELTYYPDHRKACTNALYKADENTPLLITGSLYAIGYLKEIILSMI